MRNFEYLEPNTVYEVISLLAEWGEKAKIIAGGTDILVRLKKRLTECDCLVSITSIEELGLVSEGKDRLFVGSTVTLGNLLQAQGAGRKYKLLIDAVKRIAGPQIRNMATVGGNLLQEVRCWFFRAGTRDCLRRGGQVCTAVMDDSRYHAILGVKGCFAACPSDLAVVLLALEADVVLHGKNGERVVKIDELYGYEPSQSPAVSSDELLKMIVIPCPPAGSRQVFLKFAPRPGDFAIVSVAVIVIEENDICKDIRIALGAVAPSPIRPKEAEEFLKGKPLSEDNAIKAAEIALRGAKPTKGNAYKVGLAKTAIKRALLWKDGGESEKYV
ncbi:MAG: FAD binding domain-containing protein [Candidatus Methanomethyliaceae archaeon]